MNQINFVPAWDHFQIIVERSIEVSYLVDLALGSSCYSNVRKLWKGIPQKKNVLG